jgi:glycosyltransferase involved in cell wall biosynthesis
VSAKFGNEGTETTSRPRMRLIHIVPAISEESTGPSYSVVRLCESLIAGGQDVTLGVLDWTPMASPPRFVKDFPLGMGPRRLGRSPRMCRWLDKQAGDNSIDVIHNHSLWMMPNVYPGLVARKHHVPLVVSPRGTLSEWALQHGSIVKRPFWRLVQAPALGATSCFHATAESEYKDIRRVGFRQPVAIIPNGIDMPELTLKPRENVRTLLFLGRVHPSKGLDLLLPAWRSVQSRFTDWCLVIAGPDNGGYLKKLQDLADQMQLKRIEFVGEVKGKRKWDVYRTAALFVLPTYSENFGMTVAEALAAGVPAIVSKGAPWPALEQRRAGWWIDVGLDPLVTCLNYALSQTDAALTEMGQRGRSWMEKEFSWKQLGQRMSETYRWIVLGGVKPEWVVVD